MRKFQTHEPPALLEYTTSLRNGLVQIGHIAQPESYGIRIEAFVVEWKLFRVTGDELDRATAFFFYFSDLIFFTVCAVIVRVWGKNAGHVRV